MFLVRLIYASKISNNFDHNDIANVLETARKNNAKLSVTGLLCFSKGTFLQCLEGSRSNVNRTYRGILNDPRHEDIIMLDYKEIQEREFTEWSMGYIPDSSLTEPINIRFSGSSEFNPYEMSGESSHLLMVELKNTISTIS